MMPTCRLQVYSSGPDMALSFMPNGWKIHFASPSSSKNVHSVPAMQNLANCWWGQNLANSDCKMVISSGAPNLNFRVNAPQFEIATPTKIVSTGVLLVLEISQRK